MAATTNGQTKTDFVKEVLQADPTANPKVVNDAWREAGREGTISGTLVHMVRANLGLTGMLRPRTKAPSSDNEQRPAETKPGTRARVRQSRANAQVTPRSRLPAMRFARFPRQRLGSAERNRLLEEMEGAIDHLIFTLMDIGGMEDVETALRRVRRLIVRSHEA